MSKKKLRTVEVGEKVLKANEEVAAQLRSLYRENELKGVFNLISSPGSGKTSLLENIVPEIENCGIIEGDIATARDAERIYELTDDVVQITTRGACHLDARMVSGVFPDFDLSGIDYLFIENVGNLVCPTGYDLGEDQKIVVISLPEGEDKAAKYPGIFRESAICVINKIDLEPYCDVDIDNLEEDILRVNPNLQLFRVSCKTGEGIVELVEALKS
ncbi:MAG: hydrogenase nickel incorporation protein HypB [bacterium]